jgi:hypothetical protein
MRRRQGSRSRQKTSDLVSHAVHIAQLQLPAPGTAPDFQVEPPSVVTTYVPPVPAAPTIWEFIGYALLGMSSENRAYCESFLFLNECKIAWVLKNSCRSGDLMRFPRQWERHSSGLPASRPTTQRLAIFIRQLQNRQLASSSHGFAPAIVDAQLPLLARRINDSGH